MLRSTKVLAVLVIPMSMTACNLRSPQTMSPYELYEAKQQCAESVPRVLKYSIVHAEDATEYQTHYNAKLNMCFVVLGWVSKEGNDATRTHWTLVDAQSYSDRIVEPGSNVWKRLMEDDAIDSAVAGLK